MIKDPVFLLAYLAGVVGLVFQISRLPRLQSFFDRLPALVWTYFIPMLSTSAGLIPDESVLYRALARYLLPASLVLLLISAELKAIARLGRTALVVAAIRLLRAPLFFFGAASQACVGGYSSAPIVAAIYQPSMAPLGLLLAVLGNVVGTYAGLLVAQALSGLAA